MELGQLSNLHILAAAKNLLTGIRLFKPSMPISSRICYLNILTVRYSSQP
jgi:hypothetical protein